MTRRLSLGAAATAALLAVHATPVRAQTIRVDVFRVTGEIAYVVQATDGGGARRLEERRLDDAQLVNVARGRAADGESPEHEVLAVLVPQDPAHALAARLAVFDTSTQSVLLDLTATDDLQHAFGKPRGERFASFVQARLVPTLVSPTLVLFPTTVSLGVEGTLAPSKAGRRLAAKVRSLTGPLPLAIDNADVPALATGVRAQVRGTPLASIDAPL